MRFGHFSDIHFQFENYDTGRLRKKLIAKLEDMPPLDVIFITGDIFHRGETGEDAVKETGSFISELIEASRCNIDNVFICAGNHDLKRNEVRFDILNCIIRRYNETKGELKTKGYSSIIYEDFCFPFNNICGKISNNPEPSKIHRFVALPEINLIILNTAVFAGQTYPGQKDAKKELEDTNLFICDEKFRELQAEIEKKQDINKPTICLGHHSPDCFEKQEENRLVEYLDSVHCDLYLCGHVHKPSLDLITHTKSTYRLSCGGPFKDGYNYPSFEIGVYNQESHDFDLDLFYYENSWELYTQARSPWEHGHWNWNISRIQTSVAKQSNNGSILKENGDKDLEETQEEYYRYVVSKTIALDMKGLPASDFTRLLRLTKLFVPTHFERIGIFDHNDDTLPFPINTTIRHAYHTHGIEDLLPKDKVLQNFILADPGSGKTTLIKWIAYTCCAQDAACTEEKNSPEEKYIKSLGLFPVWIRCRDITSNRPTVWDSIVNIPHLAEWSPDNNSTQNFGALVKQHIENGNALLLIDGLDEIDDKKKRSDYLDSICTFIEKYPGVRAIITSRSKGYNIVNNMALASFPKWDICPLRPKDITQLCQNWYSVVHGASEEEMQKAVKLAQKIRSNNRLRKLVSNPLMLTTLLVIEQRVGRIPNKRANLYGQAIEVLLDSWNSDVHETIDLEQAKYQLAFVAFCMMTDPSRKDINRTQISGTELQKYLQAVRDQFSNYVYTRESKKIFLEKVEKKSAIIFKSGVTKADDGREDTLYSFQHLMFEEYFAAFAVTNDCYQGKDENNKDGKVLYKYLAKPEMREVIALSAAMNARYAKNIACELIKKLKEKHYVRDEIDSLRSLLLQLIADEVNIDFSIVNEAFIAAFAKHVYNSDIELISQILTGRFGNDLKQYFKSFDDKNYNGIAVRSAILSILGNNPTDPAKQFLQHYDMDDDVNRANALQYLSAWFWINAHKLMLLGDSLTHLDAIREKVFESLKSDNIWVMRGSLDVLYQGCEVLMADSFGRITEYYSALASYINQTHKVPTCVSFDELKMECFDSALVAPTTKLTSRSVQDICDYIDNIRPYSMREYIEMISLVLFVTCSSTDNLLSEVNQVYNIVLDAIREKSENYISFAHYEKCMVACNALLKSKIGQELPYLIRDAFKTFCKEFGDVVKEVRRYENERFNKRHKELIRTMENLDIDDL